MKTSKELLAEISRILPLQIRSIFERINIDYLMLTEIRFRVNKPIIIKYNNKEYYLYKSGVIGQDIENACYISSKEIAELIQYVCNYSLYAYEEEVKQGYVTIVGGHRIGLAGKVVLEDDKVKNIKNITCVNIRISHQVIGCSKKVIPYVYDKTLKTVYHTLIISPPMSGKTTLLRDLIRFFSSSEENGYTVGLVDERSEIAACYNGIPQNDIGIRTDIMDCCPKSEGMLMLIRSMAPEIIAVDEIGTRKDIEAIEYVINCGCKMLATIHGSCIDDIRNKPLLEKLVTQRIFERYIVLDNMLHIGNVREIFDKRGNILYSDKRLCI